MNAEINSSMISPPVMTRVIHMMHAIHMIIPDILRTGWSFYRTLDVNLEGVLVDDFTSLCGEGMGSDFCAIRLALKLRLSGR